IILVEGCHVEFRETKSITSHEFATLCVVSGRSIVAKADLESESDELVVILNLCPHRILLPQCPTSSDDQPLPTSLIPLGG
ncbi:hypothetical protein PFISCL1PPCAC_1520, partial [Pristionchus fissidentatus]